MGCALSDSSPIHGLILVDRFLICPSRPSGRSHSHQTAELCGRDVSVTRNALPEFATGETARDWTESIVLRKEFQRRGRMGSGIRMDGEGRKSVATDVDE
jgi:hypothetical protein